MKAANVLTLAVIALAIAGCERQPRSRANKMADAPPPMSQPSMPSSTAPGTSSAPQVTTGPGRPAHRHAGPDPGVPQPCRRQPPAERIHPRAAARFGGLRQPRGGPPGQRPDAAPGRRAHHGDLDRRRGHHGHLQCPPRRRRVARCRRARPSGSRPAPAPTPAPGRTCARPWRWAAPMPMSGSTGRAARSCRCGSTAARRRRGDTARARP